MNEQERRRAIDVALVQMEKQFGKGAILRLGSKAVTPVSVISSGSISVDNALGVGGFPRGRVVEIFGPESSGKTTIALQVIAESQKAGGTAAFIDAEHALDPGYARALGVDVDNLLVSQPDHGEPFKAIFERYERDFYKIDPLLFSPAEVLFCNLRSGKSHAYGEVMPKVLARSFFGEE